MTGDVRESRVAVDSRLYSGNESDSQQTMTSTTSRHATLNANSRFLSRSSPALYVPTSGHGDRGANFRQTSPRAAESYLGNARMHKNIDGAAKDRVGGVDCSVQDLEKMLNQVEASERQAWNWLEALDTENGQRVGDLRHYISSLEQNKRHTSEAIAQLLQIECSLRQQLNRRRSGLHSNDPDDVMLDEVSKSLKNIVGHLQRQSGSSLTDTATTGAEHSASLSLSSTSRYPSTGSEAAAAAAGLSYRSQSSGGGGVDSDEGYDGNSNSMQSDSLHGYRYSVRNFSDSLHGYRDTEPTTSRIGVLEREVTRLTRLLDAYRWSHGDNTSAERRSVVELAAPPAYLDVNLQQAQADVRRLQSRVNDVETEKLELERDLNRATNKLRDDVEKLQTELQQQKTESNHKISELKDIETGLKRTTAELREQLDFEKDKRQCLESELLDTAEGREKLRRQLQETDRVLSDLQDKLDAAEQSNKQLAAQVNFLTKTNESLMEDIDDNNERMSEELASCRQGRTAAERRVAELEAHCEKLTETVGLLAERARALEKSLEEAERDRAECDRLRYEHGVLVASEEKLVDKINDKDDTVRRLMEELSECKTSLEEQSHKLQMANIALDSYRDDGSRCLRELIQRADPDVSES